MADRTLLIAATIKAHLGGIHALEKETLELAKDHGEGAANSIRGAFNLVDQAHRMFERAAKQIPEIGPLFGGK